MLFVDLPLVIKSPLMTPVSDEVEVEVVAVRDYSDKMLYVTSVLLKLERILRNPLKYSPVEMLLRVQKKEF